ncbi:hypothetical protein [Megamonas hypermegale]|jgi:hypothetical protein|uniref:hypothetical protein n=1 Tax=Megamonas hypermegale TaxID=158847 RepID=UPI001958E479|nr:hypothetical protein [Megamonas hypermegale]MBM6759964.1 hypothetical protein [Megamonas hypermegale]
MLKLIKGRFTKAISVLALACFLCSPLGYVATLPTASAASYSYDSRHDNPPPHKDKDRKDRHDRDRKDDDDNDYSKGNIVTAVLVGGVIGAIIAKNT